jgi:hypothetical protein
MIGVFGEEDGNNLSIKAPYQAVGVPVDIA